MNDLTLKLKGGKKGALLFHSYTGNPNDVRGLARRLNKDGYTVYAPTLKGHDQPLKDIVQVPVEDWFNQALDAYDKLKADGIEKIYVFGLSLGGLLATYVALNRPVQAFGTFSSPVMAEFKTEILPTLRQIFEKDETIDSPQMIEQLLDQADFQMKSLTAHTLDHVKHYADLTGPVFIGQGMADEMIDPRESIRFKEALVHADVTFKPYENAPHVITIGRYGVQLQRDVRAFLEKID